MSWFQKLCSGVRAWWARNICAPYPYNDDL